MVPKIWVFSIKAYVAALLALWVGFVAAVQYPYWCMMVVYILALPTTGAMRQKGVFMTAGSVTGAFLGVLSSAVFASSEIAQLVSMGMLAATAGYFAMRDRLPSFYFFLLAAITCMLVALPGLTTPDQAFSRGVERIQDVVIGVGCMLVVDMLVFPAMIGPQMIRATDAWTDALATWTKAVLRGEADPQGLKTFLAQAATVDPVARQMRYEGMGFAWSRSRVGLAMRTIALRLVPTLSLLHDTNLTASGPSPLADIRERLAETLGRPMAARDLQRLRAIRDPVAEAEARSVRRVAATWFRITRLRQMLGSPKPRWIRLPQGEHAMPGTLAHTDRRYALRTSFAVILFFTGMCLLWTFADWPSTVAIGLLLGTVFLIISGQADDPVPLLAHILVVVIIAFGIDMLYLTVILPRVTSFVTLAMVLAPALLLLGFMIVKPGGLLYAILPMALLRLGNTGPQTTADMLTTFAAGLAIGVTMGVTLSLLVRRLPPGEPLRRLRSANRAAVLRSTAPRGGHPFSTYDAIDRVASIQTRAPGSVQGDIALVRVGMATAELQRHRETRPLVAGVRDWLRTRTIRPPEALLRAVDDAVLASPPPAPALRRALGDLRLALASAMHATGTPP